MYKILSICFSLFLTTSVPSLGFSNEQELTLAAEKPLSQKTKASHTLVLYINPDRDCCKKITHYLNEIGISSVTVKSIHDPEAKAELSKLDENFRIPCLVIDGKTLYESESILEWFKMHF